MLYFMSFSVLYLVAVTCDRDDAMCEDSQVSVFPHQFVKPKSASLRRDDLDWMPRV